MFEQKCFKPEMQGFEMLLRSSHVMAHWINLSNIRSAIDCHNLCRDKIIGRAKGRGRPALFGVCCFEKELTTGSMDDLKCPSKSPLMDTKCPMLKGQCFLRSPIAFNVEYILLESIHSTHHRIYCIYIQFCKDLHRFMAQ